jgi:PAT family beta-lactamase induction signal transducer AmpG
MATGAFGVLLLRMTQKKFSATQYALFSSIFAIGRILPGPIAGFTADALGWTPFFLMSTVASIPGLFLLQRFAPLGGREPQLDALGRMESRPVPRMRLTLIAAAAGVAGFLIASAVSALLSALKAARLDPEQGVDYAGAVARLLAPSATSDWLRIGGLAIVGLVTAAGAAAFLAARYGVRPAGARPAGTGG